MWASTGLHKTVWRLNSLRHAVCTVAVGAVLRSSQLTQLSWKQLPSRFWTA